MIKTKYECTQCPLPCYLEVYTTYSSPVLHKVCTIPNSSNDANWQQVSSEKVEPKPEPPAKDETVELLREIRDALVTKDAPKHGLPNADTQTGDIVKINGTLYKVMQKEKSGPSTCGLCDFKNPGDEQCEYLARGFQCCESIGWHGYLKKV